RSGMPGSVAGRPVRRRGRGRLGRRSHRRPRAPPRAGSAAASGASGPHPTDSVRAKTRRAKGPRRVRPKWRKGEGLRPLATGSQSGYTTSLVLDPSTISRSRAWVEVRLDRLRENAAAAQRAAGAETGLVPMVKAEAYGLGMEAVASALIDFPRAGAPWAFG